MVLPFDCNIVADIYEMLPGVLRRDEDQSFIGWRGRTNAWAAAPASIEISAPQDPSLAPLAMCYGGGMPQRGPIACKSAIEISGPDGRAAEQAFAQLCHGRKYQAKPFKSHMRFAFQSIGMEQYDV